MKPHADSAPNRVAIVTGAACGIGFEVARQLVISGAAVVLNDTDSDALASAVARLRDAGARCSGVVGDAGDVSHIDQLVAHAVDTYGQLDAAVANAGITTFGDFLSYTPEQFQRVCHVNLQGTFFLAQRVARQCIAQGEGGRLVLMSSVTGVQHHPDLAAYGMTKAAIRMIAKTLGAELAPHGITVNAVAPGATLTERTLEDAIYQRTWSELTPRGKPATVTDIANTVMFLLSDESRHITSQTLVVDGGWTAISPPPADSGH